MNIEAYLTPKLRLLQDQSADTVIATLQAQSDVLSANRVFDALRTNADAENVLMEPVIAQYFRETSVLPAWANMQAIERGAHLFRIYGVQMAPVFICSSLPHCYLCKHGAMVLYRTGRLRMKDGEQAVPGSGVARRIMETLQFIINVLSPDGFLPQGNAIITIQKVRLMHASIRYFITQQAWDIAELGAPINQQDLVMTLCTFVVCLIEGLKKIGCSLSEQDIEAYTHVWSVTGYVLGIEESLIPRTYNDAQTILAAILEQQAGATPENQALTQGCISLVEHIIPGNQFDGIARHAIAYFLGQEYASMLGVEITQESVQTLTHALAREAGKDILLSEKNSIEEIVSVVFAPFSRALLSGIMHHFNPDKSAHFYIPPSLQEEWKLRAAYDDVWASPTVFDHRLSLQRKSSSL